MRFGASADAEPVVISLRGELDIATCPAIEAALEAAFRPDTDLVIDLRGVDFCSCAAISMFLRTARRYTSQGRCLRIAAPHGITRRVLAILDIDVLVPVHATTDGAIDGADSDRIGKEPSA